MSEVWPNADRPSPESVRERERVIDAVEREDAAYVVAATDHTDPRVRATAYRGLDALGVLDDPLRVRAGSDDSFLVRRTISELAATDPSIRLEPLLADADSTVVEVSCWAAGERGAGAESLVDLLASVSRDHDDPLCREAAVAALGAIGSERGLPAILEATTDRATVRRRAVIALAPFSSPEVTTALTRALEDRDWQVRQAAEDIL